METTTDDRTTILIQQHIQVSQRVRYGKIRVNMMLYYLPNDNNNKLIDKIYLIIYTHIQSIA